VQNKIPWHVIDAHPAVLFQASRGCHDAA
jgi:hypothetical protein